MVGLDNPLHIAMVLVIVLLLFGAKRLPGIGRSLGEGLRGFKDSMQGTATEFKGSLQETSTEFKDSLHADAGESEQRPAQLATGTDDTTPAA